MAPKSFTLPNLPAHKSLVHSEKAVHVTSDGSVQSLDTEIYLCSTTAPYTSPCAIPQPGRERKFMKLGSCGLLSVCRVGQYRHQRTRITLCSASYCSPVQYQGVDYSTLSTGMSITAQTSINSLISLGIGFGDVATLWAYGRKFGNFLSTNRLDEELLTVLDLDHMEILRRKGLFELPLWNKRWTEELRILANGRAMVIKGDVAKTIYGDVERFTAVMISLVAVLDLFASKKCVHMVMSELLKLLTATNPENETFIDSQCRTLIDAWRSSGVARGMTDHCRRQHLHWVQQRVVVNGQFPQGESSEMAYFLSV